MYSTQPSLFAQKGNYKVPCLLTSHVCQPPCLEVKLESEGACPPVKIAIPCPPSLLHSKRSYYSKLLIEIYAHNHNV